MTARMFAHALTAAAALGPSLLGTAGCAVASAPAAETRDAVSSAESVAVPSASDESLAGLRFGLTLPCEHPNEDAFASGGYRVVVGATAGDVIGPYARSQLVAEAGQGFAVRVCNTRPSYGGLGLLETVDISYRIDGGAITTVSVLPQDLHMPPDYWADSAAYVIPVSARASGVMEVWARVNVSGGKSYWVSRDGANFKAGIVPATQTTIAFAVPAGGVWSDPAPVGPITRGAAVRVRYDSQRMVAIMGMCPGQHTAAYVPETQAFVSFRDAAGSELIRYDVDVSSDAPIEVPGAASSVAMWFRGTCANDFVQSTAWDSRFGRNFVFPIDGSSVAR
jgi:hypothetical protein